MQAKIEPRFPVEIDNPENVDLEESELEQFREADRRDFHPTFGAQVMAFALNRISGDVDINKVELRYFMTGRAESSIGEFAVEFLMGDSLIDRDTIVKIADTHDCGVVFLSKAPLTEEAVGYIDSHKHLKHYTI